MSESFNSYEVGDEVVINGMPGLVSFICKELKTMSVLVGRGCHRSEDTKIVVSAGQVPAKLTRGWPDREVALTSLTPRCSPWYDEKDTSSCNL